MHRGFPSLLRPLLEDRSYFTSRDLSPFRNIRTLFRINSISVLSPPTALHSRPSPTFCHLPILNTKRYFASSISTNKMAATDATMRTFFSSPNFAVSGASTNPDKWGYKVFKWYVTRSLPVTPINPTASSIKVGNKELPTVASISALEKPSETSLSIITAPHITLKTLQEAKELGIPSVWLQPGTFDDEVLAFARENFKAVVAGEGGHGGEGWCVLVDGDRGLKGLGKL